MDSQALTPPIAQALDPYQAQISLENWQRRTGASRATERGWEQGAASFMAYRMIGPYLSLVLEYYERGKNHAGKHGLIWDLFGNEENVKQVALETLFQLFGMAESRHVYNSLAGSIAKRAEYILWLNHPDLKGWHLEGLRLASNNDLGMKNVISRLRDKGFHKAANYQALGRLEKVALGAFFIEAIVASTGMFSIVVDNDYRGRPYKSVQATPLYWDFLKRWKHNLMLFRHTHMPMTVPPRPYTEYADGGYLSIETSWAMVPWENYARHVERADPCVMGSINKLQSVSFTLDRDQLLLIRWAWEHGHQIGAIPPSERLPEVDFRAVLSQYGSSEAWRQVWRRKADERHDGQRAKVINTFIAADRLKAKDRLWWVWSADNRGRLYPRGSQLNYTGADPHRSLFRFDKTVPVKGHESEIAWAIGDAIGLPFAARASWLRKNSKRVCRIGGAPHENLSMWAEEKKPWRFVQLCKLWAAYVDNPGHHTGIPFQLDQTTSGYGHLACLTRDARLAEWTNITGHVPRDLYMQIAAKVHELARAQYNVSTDELLKKYLRWWLDNWPGRELFKPAIMPIIYGRRYLSMQQEIAELLVARFCHSQSPEGYQAMSLASALSKLILAGVGECLPGVLNLSRWLRKAGSGLIKKEVRPYWHTPNGLRIESYSSLTKKKSMRLVLSGKVVPIQIRDGEGQPLKGSVSHLTADYVHSMDAAFLQRFVHEWPHEIVTVHDCFATTLDQVGNMRSRLNQSFNSFYQHDYLYEYWRQLVEIVPSLPHPPCFGELDICRIGENPFLFT